MKLFVGITDWNWFTHLRSNNLSEANFWRPSGREFKALSEGDLFLFKLKSSNGGRIGGGGFFVTSNTMSTEWAWQVFGKGNGCDSLKFLNDTIARYRIQNSMPLDNPLIGCITLCDLFFFDENEWINPPGNWRSIVTGKTFDSDEPDGNWLLRQIQDRLSHTKSLDTPMSHVEAPRFGTALTKYRLGQSSFRVLVAEEYRRRCAITGESALPTLQAAHIKPVSENGPHAIVNGIFMRSDLHALFDAGYLTVSRDYRVIVSSKLRDDYGSDYYQSLDRKRLVTLPAAAEKRPSRDYLEWHNDCVFRI